VLIRKHIIRNYIPDLMASKDFLMLIIRGTRGQKKLPSWTGEVAAFRRRGGSLELPSLIRRGGSRFG
jgi:hypothetical protein